MRRLMLLLPLALAACAKGTQADLPYVGKARSLTAEWAMINEQQARGHLTATYAQTMRQQIREELQSIPSSLTVQDSAYAKAIDAALKQPDGAPPEQLRSYSDALKQAEDELESA